MGNPEPMMQKPAPNPAVSIQKPERKTATLVFAPQQPSVPAQAETVKATTFYADDKPFHMEYKTGRTAVETYQVNVMFDNSKSMFAKDTENAVKAVKQYFKEFEKLPKEQLDAIKINFVVLGTVQRDLGGVDELIRNKSIKVAGGRVSYNNAELLVLKGDTWAPCTDIQKGEQMLKRSESEFFKAEKAYYHIKDGHLYLIERQDTVNYADKSTDRDAVGFRKGYEPFHASGLEGAKNIMKVLQDGDLRGGTPFIATSLWMDEHLGLKNGKTLIISDMASYDKPNVGDQINASGGGTRGSGGKYYGVPEIEGSQEKEYADYIAQRFNEAGNSISFYSTGKNVSPGYLQSICESTRGTFNATDFGDIGRKLVDDFRTVPASSQVDRMTAVLDLEKTSTEVFSKIALGSEFQNIEELMKNPNFLVTKTAEGYTIQLKQGTIASIDGRRYGFCSVSPETKNGDYVAFDLSYSMDRSAKAMEQRRKLMNSEKGVAITGYGSGNNIKPTVAEQERYQTDRAAWLNDHPKPRTGSWATNIRNLPENFYGKENAGAVLDSAIKGKALSVEGISDENLLKSIAVFGRLCLDGKMGEWGAVRDKLGLPELPEDYTYSRYIDEIATQIAKGDRYLSQKTGWSWENHKGLKSTGLKREFDTELYFRDVLAGKIPSAPDFKDADHVIRQIEYFAQNGQKGTTLRLYYNSIDEQKLFKDEKTFDIPSGILEKLKANGQRIILNELHGVEEYQDVARLSLVDKGNPSGRKASPADFGTVAGEYNKNAPESPISQETIDQIKEKIANHWKLNPRTDVGFTYKFKEGAGTGERRYQLQYSAKNKTLELSRDMYNNSPNLEKMIADGAQMGVVERQIFNGTTDIERIFDITNMKKASSYTEYTINWTDRAGKPNSVSFYSEGETQVRITGEKF